MDILQAVRTEILRVLRERGVDHPKISAQDALIATLGLSSVDVVALVPPLNATLAVDPFAGTLAVTDMRTVGDLVDAYENARSTSPHSSIGSDVLRASAKRAEMRRKNPTG